MRRRLAALAIVSALALAPAAALAQVTITGDVRDAAGHEIPLSPVGVFVQSCNGGLGGIAGQGGCPAIGGGGGGGVAASVHVQTATVASNLVALSASGTLTSFEANADATLCAANWWVMIFDATTIPSNGTVTPAKVFQVNAGICQTGAVMDPGGAAVTTGAVVAVSTTGPFTLTASAHAFIGAGHL